MGSFCPLADQAPQGNLWLTHANLSTEVPASLAEVGGLVIPRPIGADSPLPACLWRVQSDSLRLVCSSCEWPFDDLLLLSAHLLWC